ncbi:unnamed protein product [Prunus brigantina]
MHFPSICDNIMAISSFQDPAAGDLLVWVPSSSRNLSAKDAYEFIRPKFTIINHVRASSTLAKGHMSNKVRDLCTIRSCGVRCRPSPNPKIIEVTRHPFCFGSVKINTDGTLKSDFSKASSGGVF